MYVMFSYSMIVVINSYYIVDDEGKTSAKEIGKLKYRR